MRKTFSVLRSNFSMKCYMKKQNYWTQREVPIHVRSKSIQYISNKLLFDLNFGLMASSFYIPLRTLLYVGWFQTFFELNWISWTPKACDSNTTTLLDTQLMPHSWTFCIWDLRAWSKMATKIVNFYCVRMFLVGFS